jgi:hypothetical protein
MKSQEILICFVFVSMEFASDSIFRWFVPLLEGVPWIRIGTRFLRPRGTSPLKGVNPAETPGYRNGTESFFGLKGRPSVVRDV